MDDLISRQAAIDALGEKPLVWTEGEYELGLQNQWQSDVDALNGLPSAQPEQRWIPCSERLPEDGEVILFSTKTDRVFEGRYFADNTGCQWYAFRDETFAWNNVVIAWMPLPEPYKTESEDEK